jgi:hypothetical protein
MALTIRNIIEALLPKGALWVPKIDGDFDKLLDGIGANFEILYEFLRDLAKLRDPYNTPWLEDLEKEYGVVTTFTIAEAQRREQLASLVYNKTGTGSIDDLQDALDTAGFDLSVLPNDPAVDPRTVLASDFQTMAGGSNAYAGYFPVGSGITAVAGFSGGYELVVNGDQFEQSVKYIMVAGGGIAYAGFTNNPSPGVDVESVAGRYDGLSKTKIIYDAPDAWERWRYLFYVGAEQRGWPLQSELLLNLVNSKTCIFYNNYFCPYETQKAGDDLLGEPVLNKFTDFSQYHNPAHDITKDIVQTETGITFPNTGSVLRSYGDDSKALAELLNFSIVILADFTSHTDEYIVDKSGLVTHFQVLLTPTIDRVWLVLNGSSHNRALTVTGTRYIGINVVDGTQPELFSDGVSTGLMTNNAVPSTIYNLDMYIGNDVATFTNPFQSELQAVLLFNRPLTADEHLELYNDMLLLQYPEIISGDVENERIEVLKRIILQYKPLGRWCGLFINPV